ncbi:hypothetical protein AVEN_193799-1 [Araneus ventricosus]|uniref:Uncharacterized protein n=1 Tax=Araneus ventricosus TaxID=182803 RepID=A0A4Y2DNU5_ARAVE|nr:hypothetical protein AVEN_193799-1 [Araneus ventricosus]
MLELWVTSRQGCQIDSCPNGYHYPCGDLRKHIKMLLHSKWQWDSETNKKLHAVKLLVEPWPSLANRKADTLITRLRIGHTRFTHLHLLLGEEPPMCSLCNCHVSVRHIL